MEMKQQLGVWVREVDDLRDRVAHHWAMVRRSVAAERMDDAISLLNRYFHLKQQLDGVESRLEGAIHSNFSDK